VILLLAANSLYSQIISVPDNFARLVAQEDTDGDKKITIHDHLTPFEIQGTNGTVIETVNGAYPLSILLQSLKRAEDENRFEISLDEINFNESAVGRTHRLIKEYYWDALTRRINAAHLSRVVPDSKSDSANDYLYVPAADTNAVRYFEALSNNADTLRPLKIVLLPSPDKFTGEFVRSLDGSHGLLSLALMTNVDGTISGEPYVVPGGVSTSFIAGIVTSSRLGCCRMDAKTWPAAWRITSFMKSNIMKKFPTPTARIISPVRNRPSSLPSSAPSMRPAQ
jgi:neutral trehalase